MAPPAFLSSPTTLLCSHKFYKPIQRSGRRPPIASTTTPKPTAKVTSTELKLQTGDKASISAYFARPEGETKSKAGVVFLSDIFGHHNENNRKVADLLASYSLPTIIPDLFRGNSWPVNKPVDGSFNEWLESHSLDRVHSDIRVAVEALRERGFGSPLGVIGFSFGGARTMHEISQGDQGIGPVVAVTFYPMQFDAEAVGKKATCPLLLVSGDSDPWVPMEVIEKLQETLDKYNESMEDCEIIIAEGAGHGFAHHTKTEEDEADSYHLLNLAGQWLNKYLLQQKPKE